MTGRYSALEIDTEDIAEVTVELEDKALGNIHVDYIQLPSRRNYYFYGDKGTIEWSFRDKKIGLYLASTKKWEWFDEDPDYDINEMYIEEVKHFVGVLRGEAKSITDVYKARQVLAVVEAAKKAALQNKTIVVGS
jgi:predicted dehydrogenase